MNQEDAKLGVGFGVLGFFVSCAALVVSLLRWSDGAVYSRVDIHGKVTSSISVQPVLEAMDKDLMKIYLDQQEDHGLCKYSTTSLWSFIDSINQTLRKQQDEIQFLKERMLKFEDAHTSPSGRCGMSGCLVDHYNPAVGNLIQDPGAVYWPVESVNLSTATSSMVLIYGGKEWKEKPAKEWVQELEKITDTDMECGR